MLRSRRRDRHATALRAPLLGRGWVLPRWLEQQADPDHPGYVVGTAQPGNTTARNWTLVGSLDSDRRAAVDAAGLVWPAGASWSIDWWVGAGDRWIAPAREAAVRQRLLDRTPVVETLLRLPGGEVAHRVYGARLPGEAVVIEIANDAPEPISLALAVRPYDLVGQTGIERVRVDGRRVLVGDRPAMLLPRDPGLVVTGSLHVGDAFATLEAGAGAGGPTDVACPGALAHVAVVLPLVHTGRLHVVVPLDEPVADRSRRRRSKDEPEVDRGSFDRVPDAATVASGWTSQTGAGPVVRFPDDRLAEAVEAGRRSLVLHEVGDAVSLDPMGDEPSVRETALVLGAMSRWGRVDEAARALARLADRQDDDGAVLGHPTEWADTGAFLGAIGEHWRLTRDRALIGALAEPIIRAVGWLDRHRLPGDGAATGLFPPRGEDDRRPGEVRYLDAFWALRGLQDAAVVLRALDESHAAHEAARIGAELRVDLLASLEAAAARAGGEALPSSPDRPVDETSVEALAATWPCEVLHQDHPFVMATAEAVRTRFLHGDAVHDAVAPRGLNVTRTLRLATAELAVGDLRALDRLRWVLGAATPTWTWPVSIHPRSGGGTTGAGQHGVATAELLTLARHLVVMEQPSPEGVRLQVASVVAPEWYGIDWEATGVPTHVGTLGIAVRWHGERPAVLWELDPHDDAPGWHLTVPGLDPTFRSTEPAGEALLAAPPLAEEAAAAATEVRVSLDEADSAPDDGASVDEAAATSEPSEADPEPGASFS